MKVAIMQPYFFPYIGYWQLMNTVDKFVVYDNIQYTKKGWVNRNRVSCNGNIKYITVPLQKAPAHFHVCERDMECGWENTMLRQLEEYYKDAENKDEMLEVVYDSIFINSCNLFALLYNSILIMMQYLGIRTPVYISSTLDINHRLKGTEKVKEICTYLEATEYVNPIGGKSLYSQNMFPFKLNFLRAKLTPYPQKHDFVPGLSILDIIANNSRQQCQEMLNDYVIE